MRKEMVSSLRKKERLSTTWLCYHCRMGYGIPTIK